MGDLEDVEAARRGAEWQRSRDVAELDALTAQLQAAQATIAEAKGLAFTPATDGVIPSMQAMVLEVFLRVDTSAHDAAILAAKNEGWGEACQALAWCFDNGPERDALPYLIEHNPFHAASIEQTEAE